MRKPKRKDTCHVTQLNIILRAHEDCKNMQINIKECIFFCVCVHIQNKSKRAIIVPVGLCDVIVGGNETLRWSRQSYCFIIFVWIKPGSKVKAALIRRFFHLEMITHINNRPKRLVRGHTRARRQTGPDIERDGDSEFKWIPSSVQIYWTASEAFW